MKITLGGKEYHVVRADDCGCHVNVEETLGCAFLHQECISRVSEHRIACAKGDVFLDDEGYLKYIALRLTS